MTQGSVPFKILIETILKLQQNEDETFHNIFHSNYHAIEISSS